ncbi:MAG: heat-shock protein SP21 [Planctomycetota bacterium]|nr:MAG: heat-shock protein SP21 [Planctomycetota bacterium]
MVSDITTQERRELPVTRAERTREGRTYVPNCDIIERESELVILADLPGVRAEDVDVNFERGMLTIQGRVDRSRESGRTFMHQEYGVGDFYRTFEIGEGIESSKIEAELKDGVLTLHLPKSEAIRPRKIAVRTR